MPTLPLAALAAALPPAVPGEYRVGPASYTRRYRRYSSAARLNWYASRTSTRLTIRSRPAPY